MDEVEPALDRIVIAARTRQGGFAEEPASKGLSSGSARQDPEGRP
ncbi:hypothetical protein [Streptomyces roseoviridis]|uniref:Uncharacterized protein n=1 Tax=Streptomyces roseoviridis TaxID=67361 RepID=A0ABV5QNL9_9ACTN